MIRDQQIAQRQQEELAGFMGKYAPTPTQAYQKAYSNLPENTSFDYNPTPEALFRQQQILGQPIDYNQALLDSLRLSGNPAQPQIRETLTAMQPKFVGDLRVDASGNVLSGLPTMKDGVVSQFNPLTRGYSSAPAQGYRESRILATPPEVSTNTELVPRPGGGFMQQPIFGAVQSVAAIEQAKAIAQAGGQVEQVIGADGKTYYVPRSRSSAKAVISLSLDFGNSVLTPLPYPTVTLDPGLICVGSERRSSYIFSIPESITTTVESVNGRWTAQFDEIEVYQGTFLTKQFVVDGSLDQRFILDNSFIDTATLVVKIKEQFDTGVGREYLKIDNILNITKDSEVYLLQEVQDEKYELLFGDGIFGKKLQNGSVITATYIITDGIKIYFIADRYCLIRLKLF